MTTAATTEPRAQRLAIPPAPLAIAARLAAAGLPGLALLHDADRRATGRCSYVCAAPDAATAALDPLSARPERCWTGPFGPVPRWVGVLPYEARRGLERPGWRRTQTRQAPWICAPRWLRYPAVVRVEHRSGQVWVVGRDAAARRRLAAVLRGPAPSCEAPAALRVSLAPPPPASEHLERVERARQLILAGDLYQVNLARRLDFTLEYGRPLALYARMAAVAPSPFGAVIEIDARTAVVSTSPELLLAAEVAAGEAAQAASSAAPEPPPFTRLRTVPIKGTRPRGLDALADGRLAAELDADAKERAELAMIVDVERNDLGRVCEVGSVRIARPAHVVTHRTVHHREAVLVGRVRAGLSRQQVLEAMVPSGSVTGAPKVRAMEVIAELERHRRGLYTGGLGYVAHDGSLELAMAIRTAVVRGGAGRYFTGGGIVLGSEPQAELCETQWKARQLLGA